MGRETAARSRVPLCARLRPAMASVLQRGFVFALVALIAAACGPSCGGSSGSSSSNTATAKSPEATPSAVKYAVADVCALVTLDQAKTESGDPNLANLSTQSGASIPGFCFYADTSGTKNVSVFIYAQTYSDTTAADAVQPDQIAAAFAGRIGVTNAHVVTGIGDKAFEYTATSGSGSGVAIFVFKSNVVMMIAIDPESDPKKVENLANDALGNLKTA